MTISLYFCIIDSSLVRGAGLGRVSAPATEEFFGSRSITAAIQTLTESLSKFSGPEGAGAEAYVAALEGGQPPGHDARGERKECCCPGAL